jgi:hypothetical protein
MTGASAFTVGAGAQTNRATIKTKALTIVIVRFISSPSFAETQLPFSSSEK